MTTNQDGFNTQITNKTRFRGCLVAWLLQSFVILNVVVVAVEKIAIVVFVVAS